MFHYLFIYLPPQGVQGEILEEKESYQMGSG